MYTKEINNIVSKMLKHGKKGDGKLIINEIRKILIGSNISMRKVSMLLGESYNTTIAKGKK